VVTAEANAGLVKMLPELLAEVRTLVGPRRVTVVFDRGGYSPKLFLQLLAGGFDLLTYRKGGAAAWPAPTSHGTRQSSTAARWCTSWQIRASACWAGSSGCGKCPPRGERPTRPRILTSRRDLPAGEVAFRMFERWRQENFFKYLREEYALDALVDYTVVPDDPAREVPNPKRRALTARLQRHAPPLRCSPRSMGPRRS